MEPLMATKTKDNKLTVLHIATLNQPITPDIGYGPIETVIHNIDKGLHLLGHRSIVACSGDSRVAGEHYVTVAQSIGDYWSDDTPERRNTMKTHFSRALARAQMGDIDVIQTHDAKAVEFIYDSVSGIHVPIVMTLHLQAKDSRLRGDYRRWCGPAASPPVHFASISEYQKWQYSGLVNAESVIYHGIEVEEFPVKEEPDKRSYLFTIGRVTRDKGQDKSIEIAKKTGSKLVIAGCVQNKLVDKKFFEGFRNSIDLFADVSKYPADDDYYGRAIKPLLDSDKQIIYIGEISSGQRKQWYRHARATLFPIQWGEPFGLVLIESMACGTPPIAFDKGAVPEIVLDGKTGFVVNSMSAMAEAVGRIDSIDPRECRRHVQLHFSIASMAYEYSELYHRIIDSHKISESRSSLSDSTLSKPIPDGSIIT